MLGTASGIRVGLIGLLVLPAGLQVTGPSSNPPFETITIGPWLIGRVVRSRREPAAQLAAHNTESRAEQDRYRRESVRDERVRAARDLHDIVAH